MKQKQDQPILIIRRKKHHDAHHGGAWKVAFADFMTAMFAMFLVLWLINQSSDIKSAIAGYFQDPLGRADEYGSSIMPGEGAQSQMVRRAIGNTEVIAMTRDRINNMAKQIEQQLMKEMKITGLREHVDVTLTAEGLRIELIDDQDGFFFQSGMPIPNEKGRHILEILGRELAVLPFPVRLEGHTDGYAFPDSNLYTNWELSADRANAARRILLRSGLAESQVAHVRAMADRQPKLPEDPLSPRNRRVTIMVLIPMEQDATETE